MTSENGTEILFYPKNEKTELDSECRENITHKFTNFLLERPDIYRPLASRESNWVASKYSNRFRGGPLFIIKDREDNQDQWLARFSRGPKNFIEFSIQKSDGFLSILNHSFQERDYSCTNIEDWFDSTLDSIELAENKDSLEWETGNSNS